MNIKPDTIEHIAFSLCTEFITAVNQRNFAVLQEKFTLSEAVWEEIQTEVLAYYFPEHSPILAISKQQFVVFEYDDGGWGVEAGLDDETGEWTELTLHAEIMQTKQGEYALEYRLIEVM